MREFLQDFGRWFRLVMSGWIQYAAGGLTGLIWVLAEKIRGRPFSWSFLAYVGVVFFVFAVFNVWRNESRKHAAARKRELDLQRELQTASEPKDKVTDPILVLIRERQRLESERQPLLEIEESSKGVKVVPALRLAGKNEEDFRRDRIEQLNRDIADIGRQLAILQPRPPEEPRPKIAIGWELSGKPAFGQPVTLRNVAFTNIGQESAQAVRIVPDKSKGYWVEQVAAIDLIRPDGKPVFPAIRAMHRNEHGQEQDLISSDDPIRQLCGVMLFDNLEPVLSVAIEYYSFGKKKRHLTKYRAKFDSGNPSFECIEDE